MSRPTLSDRLEGWAGSGVESRGYYLLTDGDLARRHALADFVLGDPAGVDHHIEVVLGDRDGLQEGGVHGVAAGALELHGARDVGELGAFRELHGDLACG